MNRFTIRQKREAIEPAVSVGFLDFIIDISLENDLTNSLGTPTRLERCKVQQINECAQLCCQTRHRWLHWHLGHVRLRGCQGTSLRDMVCVWCQDPCVDQPSQLEQLCINLCAETMQHFYNTHIFKSSIESCREEGVRSDIEIDYVDNVPCIDFISSLVSRPTPHSELMASSLIYLAIFQRTGLFSLLDSECAIRGTAEAYVQKIKIQHMNNSRFFDVSSSKEKTIADRSQQISRLFGIRHFAGNVVYDTTSFLESNADRLSDDIIAIFHKSMCTFGFVSHLFGVELRLLYNKETVPRGLSFRIAPTAHLDLQNECEPISTLTQDFHTRLDNLLRTLVHAKPHFIRCIKVSWPIRLLVKTPLPSPSWL